MNDLELESPDRASANTSVYAWHELADGSNPQLWGAYRDVVVRTPDGWRFASRQLRVAGQEGWDIDWRPLVDPEEA